MKQVRFSLLAAVTLATVGCSNTAHVSQTVVAGAELFNVVATPTVMTSNTGITCVGAQGKVWLKDRVIGGVITDDRKRNFKISGQLESDQSVEAGVAINGQLLARWHGQISHRHGHGSWQDESGCRGEWSLSAI